MDINASLFLAHLNKANDNFNLCQLLCFYVTDHLHVIVCIECHIVGQANFNSFEYGIPVISLFLVL